MSLEKRQSIIIIEDDPSYLQIISEIVAATEFEPISGLDKNEDYTITEKAIADGAKLLLCDDLLYSFQGWQQGEVDKERAHYQGSSYAKKVKTDFPDFPIWSISSSPSERLLQHCDNSLIKTEANFKEKLYSELMDFRKRIIAESSSLIEISKCPTFEERYVSKNQYELDESLAYLLETWELESSKAQIPDAVINRINNLTPEEETKLFTLKQYFIKLGYTNGHFFNDMAEIAYFGAVFTGKDSYGQNKLPRSLKQFYGWHVYVINPILQARKAIQEGNEFWL